MMPRLGDTVYYFTVNREEPYAAVVTRVQYDDVVDLTVLPYHGTHSFRKRGVTRINKNGHWWQFPPNDPR